MDKKDLEQEKLLLERTVARRDELKGVLKALHKRYNKLREEIEKKETYSRTYGRRTSITVSNADGVRLFGYHRD